MANNKRTIRKRKGKFGDLVLDLSKYSITAVLLTAAFKDASQWGISSFTILIIVVVAAISLGIYLQEDEPEIKKKK